MVAVAVQAAPPPAQGFTLPPDSVTPHSAPSALGEASPWDQDCMGSALSTVGPVCVI